MANLDMKGIIEKVANKVEDKDLQMELMEDITDSFKENEEVISKEEYNKVVSERDSLKSKYDELQNKYDELQNKYISRFTSVSPEEKHTDDFVKPEEEVEESKVIDVSSIF